ncbi:MAG: alpha/beta hydrolase [Sulfitobacter sp.]
MSLRARLLNIWLRRVEKPAMARLATPRALRRRFQRNARLMFHAPVGTQQQWQILENGARQVKALDVVPRQVSSPMTLLYIHGGGFVFGSPRAYSALAGTLAKALGARVVLPKYRLAPENKFPSAFDDVRCAWDGLCASGISPDKIVIGGDSAGGALALSLLADLVKQGAALPAGVFCFSPLTDMSFSGDSFSENANREAVLPAQRASEMAQMYLDGHASDDPRVSPLRGAYGGAPPVWISVGDTEILRDDARRMVVRLQADGVDVVLQEEQDLPHVWPLFHNMLPESRDTLHAVSAWITELPC